MKCPVKRQTLEMKAHPAETLMDVRMFSVLKPVAEYIQQASQVRHAHHSTDNEHPQQVDPRSHTCKGYRSCKSGIPSVPRLANRRLQSPSSQRQRTQ